MTYCLPSPFLRMVARYSLPHMLKSLHRLAIAIIIDSDDEEIDVELTKFIKKCQNKKNGG